MKYFMTTPNPIFASSLQENLVFELALLVAGWSLRTGCMVAVPVFANDDTLEHGGKNDEN